jgi:peptidylprolyl isomerase
MLRNRLLILPLLAATLAVAACGNNNDDETAATPAATETATEAPTEAATETPTPAAAEATKPEVKVPKGPAPKKLVIKDIKKGTGVEAVEGSTVSVQYVGVLYDGGKQFDASWDRGQPFDFQLGGGQVIPGWDQGVEGMKVGGRRELIIPPDLAYGAQGQPPTIPPNATLVFVIDLVSVG